MKRIGLRTSNFMLNKEIKEMHRYNKWAISVMVLIMMGVLGGCGANRMQGAGSTHPSKVPTNSTSKDKIGSDIKNVTFNFHKYLPFTPLLPSYTAGYQLTHSEVIRYLNTPQNGNSISYSASYADGFVVTEGRPNQLHFVQISPKTDLMIDNKIHATMQKHDGGKSIDFVKNNMFYDVTTINGGVSLQDLKKVCASISIPATQPPSETHISDNGFDSSLLSFIPLKAGQFYIPSGFVLNGQGSAVNISQNSKNESFQINYWKGSSYLTVVQSKGTVSNYATNSSFHTIKINGTSVYIQSKNSDLPVAVFTRPKTGVQVIIYANIPSSEIIRVVESILEM